MYHDKRFQRDGAFTLMAFSYTQIKTSTTGGFLLANRSTFDDIVDRITTLDKDILLDLSKRLRMGEHIKPENEEEIKCYKVIKDLEHVSGKVQGSGTSKKYMNNEVWSLLNYLGSPTWYITFAPSDEKNPIVLYFADNKDTFVKEIRTPNQRHRLITNNPVASARFFHFVVNAFLKHVLKVDSETDEGLWGQTKGYYGTVEQ
ncbi:hypothetical protein M422DRAFT_85565, partial [Sphaerobolus stellatus SS14]